MTDMLVKICADKCTHLALMKIETSFAAMDAEARAASAPRGFAKALQNKVAQGGVGLIAEIKKASPSAGLIREDFDPAQLAKAYRDGGASCLSVLTDKPYFQGNNMDLIAARAACALPVLRKDFIVDVWQVAEARALGSDCVLLIMAAMIDDALTVDLHAAAVDYGMDVLIEVHSSAELDRALRLPSGLIGINNRNLKTLKTDLHTTEELAPLVPAGRTVVSESGIATPDDIRRMQAVGVNCFLIGEALMKQSDVAAAARNLIS
jgi:indole-3-glycerol phosphate synthase